MRVAVIGAGIIGVTTAYELAADGHDVVVYEKSSSVAEQTSFANAGVVAPGYVTPWAAPGMPTKVLMQLFSQHTPVRLIHPLSLAQLGWVWRWWRSCNAKSFAANRTRMHRLAHYSRSRLQTLARDLHLDYERAAGYMVLLRTAHDLKLARGGLKLLAELGVNFNLIGAVKAHAIEPGLRAQTPLHAAVHLPDDEVGNCRQFAHLLRTQAQRLGARFEFQRQVLSIQAGPPARVTHRNASGLNNPVIESDFDAVVVCAAHGALPLLSGLGCRLPMIAVFGYSLTAPLRTFESHPDVGPRSGVMDESYKVAISRIGQRVRVAGSAEIGGHLGQHTPAAMATLYKVLDDWFPGSAQLGQAQAWKGARPMLPDGPPVLGPSGAEGIWLNLGHGSTGWALSCGSAKVLADLLNKRQPAIDIEGLDLSRLRG